MNSPKVNPETGNFDLHEDYLLFYSYSDGWTKEMLQIRILIDMLHNYQLDISYFSNKSEKIELRNEGPLPDKIKAAYSALEAHNKLNVKHYYNDGLLMDDMPTQYYVINHNDIIINIGMSGTYPLHKFELKDASEQQFMQLHLLIKKWTKLMLIKLNQAYDEL
jgi:hypothetical protein